MKKKMVLSILAIVVALTAIGTGLYVSQQNNSSDPATKTTKKMPSSSSSTTKLNSDSSKKSTSTKKKSASEPFTRTGVVHAAQTLLQDVNKAPDGKMTDEKRLDALKKDKNSYKTVISNDVWNRVHLVDFMKTDARGGQLTAEALINVTHSIKQSGNKTITAAASDTYSGIVYFDKENKIAIVPVDIFTSASTNLGMEFIYKDGKWIFMPYSLISEITIRVTDQEALANTPEGSTSSFSKSSDSAKSNSPSASSSSSSSK